MSTMILRIIARLQDSRGQALAEYGLVLGLVAVAAMIAMGLLGVALSGTLDDVRVALDLP